MVEVIRGNLFDSSAQTLVNAVNCVGVMGKGIALEFRRRYPAMFADYQRRCRSKQVVIGRPYLYRHSDQRWIRNFPTKQLWRSRSRPEYIVSGLEFLRLHYRQWGITSIAFPLLATGLGGLDRTEILGVMTDSLKPLTIPVAIFIPDDGELAGPPL